MKHDKLSELTLKPTAPLKKYRYFSRARALIQTRDTIYVSKCHRPNVFVHFAIARNIKSASIQASLCMLIGHNWVQGHFLVIPLPHACTSTIPCISNSLIILIHFQVI